MIVMSPLLNLAEQSLVISLWSQNTPGLAHPAERRATFKQQVYDDEMGLGQKPGSHSTARLEERYSLRCSKHPAQRVGEISCVTHLYNQDGITIRMCSDVSKMTAGRMTAPRELQKV